MLGGEVQAAPEPARRMMSNKRELLGHEVWHWPELQAFLKRLGVDPPDTTSGLVITIVADEFVQVQQTHEPTITEPRKDFYVRPAFSQIKPLPPGIAPRPAGSPKPLDC
jgi:hypothetical protein